MDYPREHVQREKIVGSIHPVSRTSSGIHLRAVERHAYFILAWCANQRVPKDHSPASSQHHPECAGVSPEYVSNPQSGPLSRPSVNCARNATENGTYTAQSSNPWSSLLPVLTSTNPSPVCDECNWYVWRTLYHPGSPGPFSEPFTRVELELIGSNNRYLRCVLLCGMYTAGEGPRRLSQDRQPKCESNGPLL